ncbi:SUKH-4 family immunity protein [Streptomyces sp. NPDC056738]|uniref:SUKH-4 family immunity protein n=1 Tax=Streptomyces sp. NPDC056738 TaxID=3345933 RepID=UPI0036C8B0B6
MNNDQGVGWAAVEGDLRFVLSQPLERLIAGDQQVLIPEAQGWDIPESDRRALRELGLPRLPLFTFRPQSSPDPVLAPNLASTYERRFIEGGRRLYDLGFWGPSEDSFVVGVVPGDGCVLCLLPEPPSPSKTSRSSPAPPRRSAHTSGRPSELATQSPAKIPATSAVAPGILGAHG